MRNLDNYRTPFFLFIGFIFSYCAQYGFNIFFARVLGSATYGNYAVAIRILSIIAPLTILGTSASSKRFVTQYITNKKPMLLSGYLFWNLQLFLTASVLTIILTSASIILLISLHLFKLHDILSYHLAIYFIYCAPLLALTQLLSNILIAFRYFIFASYLGNIGPYSFMSLFLWLFWKIDGSPHNLGITCIILLSYFLVLIIFASFIFFNKKSLRQYLKGNNKVLQSEKKEWRTVAKRFSLNAIVVCIIDALDVVFIEILLKDEKLVGYYAAALTITKIVWLIRYGFNTFISVNVADYFTKKDMTGLQSILTKTNVQQIIITTMLCSALIYFSSELLHHFGPGFEFARKSLIILVIFAGLTVTLSPATIALIYSSHENLVIRINILTLISFIIVCPMAIYALGINGAAMTTAAGYLIPRIVGAILARKKLHIKTCGFV